MDATTLARLNPWWRGREHFARDPTLAALERAPLRFERSGEVEFSANRDAIYTLRGPRQAGKTTLLKQRLAEAAERGVAAGNLLYLSCDLETRESLTVTLTDWLEASRAVPRRIAVLDEAADVPDWPVVLRHLANTGLLKGVTLVVSGSHALDLRRARETLPGRRGEGTRPRRAPNLDQVLLPAAFRTFARARVPELAALGGEGGSGVFSARDIATSGRLPRAVNRLLPYARELHKTLDEYLLCGGFPNPAIALARFGSIPADVYRMHAASAGADLARFGLSERSAAQVARRVVEVLSTPISWTTLASTTDIRTHVTAKLYAEALESAFLVHTVAPLDLGRKRADDRRERKLYPADPFLLHTLRAWGTPSDDPFSDAVDYLRDPARRGLALEAVVAAALARWSPPGLFSGLDVSARLTYLKTRGGREVDFVVLEGGHFTPVEVKSRADSKVDRKAMSLVGPGVIVTARETSLSARPRVIEAPFFLYLLADRSARSAGLRGVA